ncbi:hypothetical protein RchiOBHm_Chr7g0216511 [Rosa chinensis]|uniref:Uncharacterized protein n=1 Tax=Rosa chinensis TaxID=74649 RepID=A0A2P6PBR5_ROSCH|nr:hypothetical protein RchiOBHm_Chr7g0216511 [Rosa chinensis]
MLVLCTGKKKLIKECEGWVFQTSNRSHELVAGASKRFDKIGTVALKQEDQDLGKEGAKRPVLHPIYLSTLRLQVQFQL